ncbi:hypothetical protein K488DRAFT_50537 [Vararia minispora EC-137]|uniref:Uncharacterized protein n=1 Tax=Vararia minispora EC-137 TaxID=1314806 RepID=A0ACB8QKF4_9AGAM|nr:hypothetical protein K488DRAFT_50537 [Vararia minispora EC-137]
MPPPPKPEPPLEMFFTTNSLRNTTLAVDDDTAFFEIVTRFWHPRLTKIFKLDKEAREMTLVAEIERDPGKNPRVRFGGEHGEWVSASEFLKWDPETRGGTWSDIDGTEYRWKSHKRYLQLVKADDVQKTPIAKYRTCTRHLFVFNMRRHAALLIHKEATGYMDRLIVSYLLVEKRRRDLRLRAKVNLS